MSWLYSRALVEEYSEENFSDGEPSALSNGKPTQLVFSSADRTKEFSRRSQSGMTFKPLTEDRGEGVLTSFLEAFPVRTLAALGKAKASKETDHPCGNTWRESLEKYDLDTHSWKTHQCLWDEDLQPSSVILPKWGMMLNGVSWERTTLPRLTSGTGSGLWPTPTTHESEHPNMVITQKGRREPVKGKTSYSLNLADSVKVWPTPRARDWKGTNAPGGLIRDDGRVRLDELPNAVKYITPRVGGEESFGSVAKRKGEIAAAGHNTLASIESQHGEQKGHLSPDWVEWLMGWPIGWTNLETNGLFDWLDWKKDPAESGKTPRMDIGIANRTERLKAIGNGQVPQVAEMAWKTLNTKH
jgi:hypothetical protein